MDTAKLSEYDVEPDMAAEMGWEDAPDMDKAWRVAVVKSKSEECRRVHLVMMMVGDIVEDMISKVEPVAVAWAMVDSLTSSLEGSIKTIWNQLEIDPEVKKRMKRMMKEKEEERLLM